MGRIQEALERAETTRDERRKTPRQLVRLMHQSGSFEGREQRFHGDSILIGRAPHNDVALDPFEDSTVSSQHAEIRLEAQEFVLYDMGSLNGTFVNGYPVRRAIIVPGDAITLGRSGPRLEFQVDQVDQVDADPVSGPGPRGYRTPVAPISVELEDFPGTEKTPIQSSDQPYVPNTLLIVLLLGIVLDIVINLVRMF
ncbi:MAG: pSer/pThr/pTyr-binding forkhead associated (FHA) protein [Planctomycetota bacterium]|jgi:pSer/pThr/pTyr-binding forkhead associated (FHA) protein